MCITAVPSTQIASEVGVYLDRYSDVIGQTKSTMVQVHLYHGWFSLTNHLAVLEVSISDRHLVGGIYLDRHLPLRLFA